MEVPSASQNYWIRLLCRLETCFSVDVSWFWCSEQISSTDQDFLITLSVFCLPKWTITLFISIIVSLRYFFLIIRPLLLHLDCYGTKYRSTFSSFKLANLVSRKYENITNISNAFWIIHSVSQSRPFPKRQRCWHLSLTCLSPASWSLCAIMHVVVLWGKVDNHHITQAVSKNCMRDRLHTSFAGCKIRVWKRFSIFWGFFLAYHGAGEAREQLWMCGRCNTTISRGWARPVNIIFSKPWGMHKGQEYLDISLELYKKYRKWTKYIND